MLQRGRDRPKYSFIYALDRPRALDHGCYGPVAVGHLLQAILEIDRRAKDFLVGVVEVAFESMWDQTPDAFLTKAQQWPSLKIYLPTLFFSLPFSSYHAHTSCSFQVSGECPAIAAIFHQRLIAPSSASYPTQ